MPTDMQATDPTPAWGACWDGQHTDIAVWAPDKLHIAVVRPDGAELPLHKREDGWHLGTHADLPPGSLYRIAVDGRQVPDPASRWQPDGPDGWSEVADIGTYGWNDAGWQGRPWDETVLYELHVGTFSADGTFAGVIPHLDHLAALGVTMIELMPVGTFAGAHGWGYDGVLMFAPYAGYGRPEDLKRLIDECHHRRISVVLDVVYNHFGPLGNYLPSVAPGFFTDRHHTPWGDAINFDGAQSRPVRDFFIQNALYWLEEFHFDGLRLDAVQAVIDDSPTHFLAELAERAHAARAGRTIHLTLENDDNEARWLARDTAGAPLLYAAQWNDDFHHAMRVLLTGRRDGYYRDYAVHPLTRIGRALTEGFSYQGEESVHRPGLIRGTKSAHLPPTAFVSFLQNHDQVGNTPFGKRLSDLASPAALRLGTAVMLLAPPIPMLFMGQEWGSSRPFDYFCNFPEPLASAVRDGRREEFSHLPEFADPGMLQQLVDPTSTAARDGSVLDWHALREPAHAAWLEFHTSILDVRRSEVVPLLAVIGGSAGSFRVLDEQEDGSGAIEACWRLADDRRLILTANFSDRGIACVAPGDTLFRLTDSAGDHLAPWDLRLSLQVASV